MWLWFHKLASPPHAYRLLGKMAPWFGWPALALILLATWWGLVKAPADYQQGDAFRILYVHAPSAWMSMFIYVVMAVAAAVGMQMDGDSPAGPLQLLAAIFFMALSLGPLAMSAAIRISVES